MYTDKMEENTSEYATHPYLLYKPKEMLIFVIL